MGKRMEKVLEQEMILASLDSFDRAVLPLIKHPAAFADPCDRASALVCGIQRRQTRNVRAILWLSGILLTSRFPPPGARTIVFSVRRTDLDGAVRLAQGNKAESYMGSKEEDTNRCSSKKT